MKYIVRLIILALVALFVYWGATSDTLINYLNDLAVEWEPTVASWGEAIDAKIDVLNEVDDTRLMVYLNRFLLGCSCLALVVAVICRFALRKSAERRDVFAEIDIYIILLLVCILLTAFRHSVANWWSLLAIPVFSYAIFYPLLYIPYYRYFRWVFATFYDIFVLVIGWFYLFACLSEPSLIGKILAIVCGFFAAIFYFTHRKFDSCPKCKRYINIQLTEHHIDETDVSYSDLDRMVATGYIETTTYDKYGHKVGSSSVATGWKRVLNTIKRTTKYYTDHLQCPYCGHKFTKKGKETSEKSLGYKNREERAGTYIGDVDANKWQN